MDVLFSKWPIKNSRLQLTLIRLCFIQLKTSIPEIHVCLTGRNDVGASCCNTIKSNQMVGADRRKPSGKGAGGITEAPCQRDVINGLWKKEPSASNYVSTEKWEKTAERWFIRAPNGRISQHPDSPGDSPVFTPEGVNHRP